MAMNQNDTAHRVRSEVVSNNAVISAGAAILALMGAFALANSPEVIDEIRHQSLSSTGQLLDSAEKHARWSLVPSANR